MKKIQKQYERKVKVNYKNDVFTTFQRQSPATRSPLTQHKTQKQSSLQQTQHEHIESLKHTLKALTPASMELTKQVSRIGVNSENEQQLQQQKNQEYRFKLDTLTKNLQQIASKCYFSPANASHAKERVFSNKQVKLKASQQKSQTLSRYQHLQPEPSRNYCNHPSLEFSINRNKSFVDNQYRGNHSQSRSKKAESSSKELKNNQQLSKYFQPSNAKSSSKKDLIAALFQPSANSRNISKILESYSPNDSLRRDTPSKNASSILFSQKVHRHKITSILLVDQIYTASLDYTIKAIAEQQAEFRVSAIQKYRGGVQHLGIVNHLLYGCGRDNYIRSIDGNYFYRFQHTPRHFAETDKTNLINVSLSSDQLKLFDLEKRSIISSIALETSFHPMSKFSKEIYLGTQSALFAVDWRKKDYLINLYKDQVKQQSNWISDPYSKTFWFQSKGQLTPFTQQFRPLRKKSLPNGLKFSCYSWNRNGLHILTESSQQSILLRYDDSKEAERIDSDPILASRLVVRQKQIIYGGREGDLLIKQLRK